MEEEEGMDGTETNADYRGGEDTVSNKILGTDNNSPLVAALVFELQHPFMSILGGHRVRL